MGESSLYHTMDESTPSGSGAKELLEDFDAWLNEQGIDDDEVPTEEVSSELLAEVSERGMTFDDIQRMHNAINIMMRDRYNLEELNTRWVKKTIKRFNLYARYVIDHWKSPWAQHDHIKRQMNKRDNPEEVYSIEKIAEVV
ncbi:hypothetical protein Tco_0730538 [Tanacetum coccineum]|uniref:Uncharacterized protein n=1 Tax=Tanacetum coccineum TaxID=301880 RepID=A0ABQ4YSY1_9ASTR